MGRRIPYSPEAIDAVFHPLLALSFVVAWIIASLAIITSLCASFRRKPASSKPSPSKPASLPSNTSVGSPSMDASAAAEAATIEVSERKEHSQAPSSPEEEKEETTKIEMMPEAATHGPILPTVVLPPSASKRKMSISLSTRLPEKIKSKREQRRGKTVSEDSIWKRTIILGEKCKVPNGDEEEEELVVCDENGDRQKIYHPRTPRSVPVSRNASFASPREMLSG